MREVLQAIYEQDFLDCSYGFRPKRSAHDAMRAIHQAAYRGEVQGVLEADVQSFFDSLTRVKLKEMLQIRIADGQMMRLIGKCLHVGILDGEEFSEPDIGTTQGSILSPLLGNVYLHYALDVWFEREIRPTLEGKAQLVRYADDFVVMCRTRAAVDEAQQRVSAVLARLGLELHPEKTRVVDLSWGHEGFDLLGCHLRKRLSGPIRERTHRRVYFLQRWPTQRAMQRVRTRIRELTPRGRCHEDLRSVIADVNAVVRGWGQYFRTANAATRFAQLDRDVEDRVPGLVLKRHGSRCAPGRTAAWDRPFFEALGLCRLRGTVQYPGAA